MPSFENAWPDTSTGSVYEGVSTAMRTEKQWQTSSPKKITDLVGVGRVEAVAVVIAVGEQMPFAARVEPQIRVFGAQIRATGPRVGELDVGVRRPRQAAVLQQAEQER